MLLRNWVELGVLLLTLLSLAASTWILRRKVQDLDGFEVIGQDVDPEDGTIVAVDEDLYRS